MAASGQFRVAAGTRHAHRPDHAQSAVLTEHAERSLTRDLAVRWWERKPVHGEWLVEPVLAGVDDDRVDEAAFVVPFVAGADPVALPVSTPEMGGG